MGMPWLQTKQYTCPTCGGVYLHDLGHRHACYECPARPAAIREQLLALGKTYCPTPEGTR